MKRFVGFFKEAYEELKKVVWPSRDKLLKHAIIVFASVVVVMLILIVIDFGLSKGVQSLIKISQTKK